MNILVTGSKGFIGRHLTEYLIYSSDHKVYAPSSNELNLLDEHKLDKYIELNNINFIIHAANKGWKRKASTMKNVVEYNLRMFFNLAKHEKELTGLINFGSGAEYGKNKPIINALEEDALFKFPLDEYGFYKSIISRYIDKSDNMINFRIFGCYGEYENYKFKFISNAIIKNLLHLPIVINQNVFFDYIYVHDLIKIISFFINNKAKFKNYNLTTGKKIDLITLSNIINNISDFKSEIVILNDGLNNEYTSDNRRILKELGNFKFTEYNNAIEKMIRYYESIINRVDKNEIIQDEYLKYCKISRKN
jgi:GDP-L-fucose synthase